ncbi:polysaccharide export protein EpsE [Ramlibacter sp. AW1]|uniref:Polysaccharide export protein EpsE n=1 Tax=Ramlibacter aurantiacus TaxID=2801330 RepID=A0A936ZPP8_9BURK|nr:polysaccharide export protein EpsE [Ramlibacter aurantiacus]MBL0420191.1 polysaccharide export protein EpsE [Ramlibacter aurantiacus]
MTRQHHLFICALALCGVWVAAQAQAQGQQRAPTATNGAARAQAAAPASAGARPAQPGPEYKLGSGDAVRIQVFQNPDLTVEARVSENGTISYPLIGTVAIGGLSIGEAEKKIADMLVKGGYLRAPQVNMNLLQVRGNQVAVLGQVQKPGRFPLETTNVRASEMLAAAGGITPQGDDELVITGTRNGKPFRKVIDIPSLFSQARPEDDIVLQDGDTLYISRAPVFYIYGEAQRPGPYRVERGMTVMQAIAAGGGVTPRGSQNRLRLHRPGPDGKIVESTPRLTDPVMPNDVIYVRESLF